MDSVFRGLIVYLFLLVVFRLSGKRTLAQFTPFDLVLVLIISETIQQALVDNDHSWTNAGLLVLTLVGTSILLSLIKERSPFIERLIDGLPVLIIEKGKMHEDRMAKLRIDVADIMHAAREQEGLERLDQIEHAVVEISGRITLIPKKSPE